MRRLNKEKYILEANKKWEGQQYMYKFNFIIIINMLIKQNYLLNLPKYDTQSGLTEMNSLETITLSISSVRSLCTCSNIQLFSRFSVIVDLRYVETF